MPAAPQRPCTVASMSPSPRSTTSGSGGSSRRPAVGACWPNSSGAAGGLLDPAQLCLVGRRRLGADLDAAEALLGVEPRDQAGAAEPVDHAVHERLVQPA